MGIVPLPKVLPPEASEEAKNAFVLGLILNPPRQSWWANWHTRHLRRQLREMGLLP